MSHFWHNLLQILRKHAFLPETEENPSYKKITFSGCGFSAENSAGARKINDCITRLFYEISKPLTDGGNIC